MAKEEQMKTKARNRGESVDTEQKGGQRRALSLGSEEKIDPIFA